MDSELSWPACPYPAGEAEGGGRGVVGMGSGQGSNCHFNLAGAERGAKFTPKKFWPDEEQLRWAQTQPARQLDYWGTATQRSLPGCLQFWEDTPWRAMTRHAIPSVDSNCVSISCSTIFSLYDSVEVADPGKRMMPSSLNSADGTHHCTTGVKSSPSIFIMQGNVPSGHFKLFSKLYVTEKQLH